MGGWIVGSLVSRGEVGSVEGGGQVWGGGCQGGCE